MIPLLLFAACKQEDPKPDSDPPPLRNEEQCDPEDLPPETLGWTEPGAAGVAAADVLGFALGAHTAALTWDDGTTTDATLTVTAGSATQQRTGASEVCPVSISATAEWALGSADGRLSPSGSADWEVQDAAWPPGGVVVSAALGESDLALAPLNAGSSRYLRLFVDDTGALASLQVEEAWPLGTDRNRVCVRGSLDPSTLACEDTGENDGPD